MARPGQGWEPRGQKFVSEPQHFLPSAVCLGPSHLITVSFSYVMCTVGMAVIIILPVQGRRRISCSRHYVVSKSVDHGMQCVYYVEVP